jgi:hypothetical protein
MPEKESHVYIYECHTAILIIIEGQFQVFQRFSSSKLVLKTVGSRCMALNYYGNVSIIVTRAHARSVQQNVDRTKWLEKAWEMQAIEMDTLQKLSFTTEFLYSCNLRLSVCASVNMQYNIRPRLLVCVSCLTIQCVCVCVCVCICSFPGGS